MMDKKLFIDSAFRSLNFNGERICGDSFLIRTSPSGRRTIAVLSDGMGHGIKANILSTFTSTMLLNFITSHDDIDSIADIILRMLPVNPKYDVSYSTFTLADIDNHTGEISIVQYDNPPVILLRGGIPSELNWEEKQSVRENGKPLCMRTARFMAKENDRLVMVSDGVTQSGQRNESYKFGWSHFELQQFISYIASVNNGISSADIAAQVVSRAKINDDGKPCDDMSCASLYFRTPRRMMLISCPPALPEDNQKLIETVGQFEGEKAICGHPVAQILADGMGARLEKIERSGDPLDVPVYRLPTFDLVTEGMVVPNRVLDMLEHTPGETASAGVAGALYRMLMRHDEIEFVIGLRRNPRSGANSPDEFSLRRRILRQMAAVLSTGAGKEVRITYL